METTSNDSDSVRMSPDLLAEARQAANEEHRSADELIREAVQRYLTNRHQLTAQRDTNLDSRPAYELPPEEWVRKFHAWTQSHAKLDLPLLSDEDISRESIYAERGL